MEGEKDDLLHDYNLAKVMAVKEVKAAKLILEQQKIYDIV